MFEELTSYDFVNGDSKREDIGSGEIRHVFSGVIKELPGNVSMISIADFFMGASLGNFRESQISNFVFAGP